MIWTPMDWYYSRRMKWPSELWFIRHGQSKYNILKSKKEEDPEYRAFVAAFDRDWESAETRELAVRIWRKYSLDCGDWNTPLTNEGWGQANAVGMGLSTVVDPPDVIFRSPHDRTEQTLKGIMSTWPELRKVRVVNEPRLYEQDHGLAILYNDWRVFFALNHDQKRLYDLQGPYWYRYPQGENRPDVIERHRSFVGTLVRDYSKQKVAVISHHLSILAFIGAIQRWDQDTFNKWDRQQKPINCGFTLFRGNPRKGDRGKLELVDYNRKLY